MIAQTLAVSPSVARADGKAIALHPKNRRNSPMNPNETVSMIQHHHKANQASKRDRGGDSVNHLPWYQPLQAIASTHLEIAGLRRVNAANEFRSFMHQRNEPRCSG